MKRLRCWWDGFAGTILDPRMWLLGSVDGHVYEIGSRYEVVNGRELEYERCARCGREVLTNWRTFYGVQP